MKWHRRLDAWVRAHPGRVDATVAIALFVIVGGLTVLSGFGSPGGLSYLIGLLFSSIGLAWAVAERRVRPRRALWLTIASCLLQLFLVRTPTPMDIVVPIIVYSATAYGKRADSNTALVASAAGSVLATAAFTPGSFGRYIGGEANVSVVDPATFVGILVMHLLLCAVAWAAGDLTRTRRLAVEAIADRAHRLEQEQAHERALAAADERRRIAREMHDVVAHSLSVIIAQADGARYAASADPTIATKTLGTIADAGRGALREMRSLLGVLRAEDDEAAPTAPTPDLGRVPDLVESTRTAGLPLDYTVRGQALRPLPAGAELAAFRAAQEALTNVLKHAGPGAKATLDLTWTARGLTLTVTDNGKGATPSDGRGRGQQGMRERAALYGGSATFGPRGGGGYAVTVFLPYQEI